jgi:hypothetical protein
MEEIRSVATLAILLFKSIAEKYMFKIDDDNHPQKKEHYGQRHKGMFVYRQFRSVHAEMLLDFIAHF